MSNVAFASSTLFGGGLHYLQNVPVPANENISNLAAVSGYVLASVGDSQKFYWINPGEVTINPLNFASKESNPDSIVSMVTVGDQVLISGDASSENWYATGELTTPFAPVNGRVYARGAIDKTAVAVQDGVILVGNDGIVYQIGSAPGTNTQYGVNRISNHGIEERIRRQLRREQGLTP